MATDFSKYTHQQLYDMLHNMNSDGGIDAIAGNATNAAQQLEQMVTQYMNQVAGIGQSWTGKAADGYMQFASNLGTAAKALTDQMNSVGGTLTSVSSTIAQAKSDMPPVPTDAINQLSQWHQTTPVSGRDAGLNGGYTQTEITSGINANQATIDQAHSKAVSAMANLASMYPIYTQELTSSNASVIAAITKAQDVSSTSTGSTSTSSGSSSSSGGSKHGVTGGSGSSSSSGPRSYGTSSSGAPSPNGYRVVPVTGSGPSSTNTTISTGSSGGNGVTPPAVGASGSGSTTGSSGSSLAGVGSGSGYTAGSGGLGGLSGPVGAGGGAGGGSGTGPGFGRAASRYAVGGAAGLGGLGRLSEAVGGGDGGYEAAGGSRFGSGSSRTTTSRGGAGAGGEDGAAGPFGSDSGAAGSHVQGGADSSTDVGGMMGGMGGGAGGAGGGQSQRGQRAKYLTQDPEWWYGDALKNNLPAGGLIEE